MIGRGIWALTRNGRRDLMINVILCHPTIWPNFWPLILRIVQSFASSTTLKSLLKYSQTHLDTLLNTWDRIQPPKSRVINRSIDF